MIRNSARFMLLVSALVFLGCGGSKQPAVVHPYARAFDKSFDQEIVVVLDPSLPEAMSYSGAGLKTLTMSDFKTVFKNALANMFSKNFTGTRFAESKTGEDYNTARYQALVLGVEPAGGPPQDGNDHRDAEQGVVRL